MASSNPGDRVREIIAATELSLSLIGFMHYYLVQLPEQQRKLNAQKTKAKFSQNS